MDISKETDAQTDQRLRVVIAASNLVMHSGVWCFRETELSSPPTLAGEVLAVVRDEDRWSALVPLSADDADAEGFGLFSFHFPAGVDNSGFVGWLATHLKRELGTGVFVVCGSNRRRGGIYDYWGCPIEVLAEVEALLKSLRSDEA